MDFLLNNLYLTGFLIVWAIAGLYGMFTVLRIVFDFLPVKVKSLFMSKEDKLKVVSAFNRPAPIPGFIDEKVRLLASVEKFMKSPLKDEVKTSKLYKDMESSIPKIKTAIENYKKSKSTTGQNIILEAKIHKMCSELERMYDELYRNNKN